MDNDQRGLYCLLARHHARIPQVKIPDRLPALAQTAFLVPNTTTEEILASAHEAERLAVSKYRVHLGKLYKKAGKHSMEPGQGGRVLGFRHLG